MLSCEETLVCLLPVGRSTSCLVREKSSLPPESDRELVDVIDGKGSATRDSVRREVIAGAHRRLRSLGKSVRCGGCL